jgi:hypothetical protein
MSKVLSDKKEVYTMSGSMKMEIYAHISKSIPN